MLGAQRAHVTSPEGPFHLAARVAETHATMLSVMLRGEGRVWMLLLPGTPSSAAPSAAPSCSLTPWPCGWPPSPPPPLARWNIVFGFHVPQYPQGHQATDYWRWIKSHAAYPVQYQVCTRLCPSLTPRTDEPQMSADGGARRLCPMCGACPCRLPAVSSCLACLCCPPCPAHACRLAAPRPCRLAMSHTS